MRALWLISTVVWCVNGGGESSVSVEADVASGDSQLGHLKTGKNPEDSIPVIEIRGEGKPMTAAQIRALEEQSEGKPLDIKVKHTWRPRECPRAAKRKDFVTFQYKGFLEDGKKFDQSFHFSLFYAHMYGRDPVRMQLGVGMTLPGLDKGLRGMCDQELRKIQVPWRLSKVKRSKVWKYVPKEEHWLTFDIEMLTVEAWTPELQFEFMDLNNDTSLTPGELTKHLDRLRKEFGKHWPNEDIDNVLAASYFVKYFDADHDGKVSKEEYVKRMKSDLKAMSKVKSKPEGRKRDPGLIFHRVHGELGGRMSGYEELVEEGWLAMKVGWILDFNNDGIVTAEELDDAVSILENPDESLRNQAPMEKDEL